jgi:hypothetical protein
MARGRIESQNPFDAVTSIGLTMPGVEATVRRGVPTLTRGGAFMACLAGLPSAEPATLVVRYDDEERAYLLDDAPDVYYLTDYYRKWPVILARLSRLSPEALRDLLSVSWRLTAAKMRPGYASRSSDSRRSR